MEPKFIDYNFAVYDENSMLQKSLEYFELMDSRRTVREFSNKPVPKEIIENIVRTASTAPSGAHKQPWIFCIVTDHETKKQIREAAEKEEYESYNGRMNDKWLEDLAYLGTDWHKPFLETAPCLIIVFKKLYDLLPGGEKRQNYYVTESVGIACGFLLAAIHNAGLCALTHTPSPMGFLSKILDRPDNERPFLLIPVGYPADEVTVPDLKRKDIEDVSWWY